MLLAYHANPSSVAVGEQIGVTRHTVRRCVRRAEQLGVMAALDDSPRPGKAPVITPEARAWLVSLACQKAKDLGYPHELWTTRLLARHAREHAQAAGHPCLATIVQGTVCKILARQEVKPHKVRHCLERRDEAFEAKMADVLCVYREVALLRESEQPDPPGAIISYDEKPGIQAIGNTAPDLPPRPGSPAAFARDHEYKRHGTLSLLAGIDLLTGQVHASVEDRHRSREFVGFLKKPDAAYPAETAIEAILDNHSAHLSKETKAWIESQPEGRFSFVFTPSTAPGSTSSRASSPGWRARCSVTSEWHPKPNSKPASSPTSKTSTATRSSITAHTKSPRRRYRSRSMETMYYD